MSMATTTLVKMTEDGRKLEVIGLAICLDGELEAFELIEVKMHPNRRAIWQLMPEATHVAGRVVLTREEADIVFRAFKEAEAQILCKSRRHQRAVPHRRHVEGARAGHRIASDRVTKELAQPARKLRPVASAIQRAGSSFACARPVEGRVGRFAGAFHTATSSTLRARASRD